MKKNIKNAKGFTLIELLVVLAIIGILIALAIVGLRAAQATQRDTARKDIGNQLNAALQSFISNTGSAPTVATFYVSGGTVGTDFITGLCTYNGVASGGVNANGSCIGIDGLSGLTVEESATACGTWVNPNNGLNLCYEATGSAGYTIGTMLEGGDSVDTIQN